MKTMRRFKSTKSARKRHMCWHCLYYSRGRWRNVYKSTTTATTGNNNFQIQRSSAEKLILALLLLLLHYLEEVSCNCSCDKLALLIWMSLHIKECNFNESRKQSVSLRYSSTSSLNNVKKSIFVAIYVNWKTFNKLPTSVQTRATVPLKPNKFSANAATATCNKLLLSIVFLHKYKIMGWSFLMAWQHR